MKERPILFSGPLVRAIMGGRKTQTRRVVVPQPLEAPIAIEHFHPHIVRPDGEDWHIVCPYGAPGDRLWVRESLTWDDKHNRLAFSADLAPVDVTHAPDDASPISRKTIPSIFMPRWACRLLLTLTAVGVERLQDITESDAVAEGFGEVNGALIKSEEFGATLPQAIYQFAKRWDELNAKRGYPWASNPWVWVLTFKPVAKARR